MLELSDEEILAASDDISESEDDFEDDFKDIEEVPKASNKRVKLSKPGKRPQDSDSEASAAPEEEDDVGGWGTSRKDYYDADKIETEADALEEEAEAKRLQQKQLQGMTEADFGFDEVDWLEAGKDDEDEDDGGRGRVVREILPKLEITNAMGPEERLKIMRTRYPEFEPLAKEFLGLQPVYEDLKIVAAEVNTTQQQATTKLKGHASAQAPETPVAAVKYSALSAYLAVLSMYFALLTSGQAGSDGKLAAMPPEQLRDHTIMETLVQCRDLWEKVKNIALPETIDLGGENGSLQNGHDNEVLATNGVHVESEEPPKARKHKRSKAQKAAEAAQAEADARRAETLRQMEVELADLSGLRHRPSKPSKSSQTLSQAQGEDDSDFGEQTFLTPHEAAEKAKRKKSLKFYTSQIAQKANKRDAGGRDAGGDADIPYRERLKDRQARLNAEAEKCGKKPKESSKGARLGGSSDEEDHATARELREKDSRKSEDYYNLVTAQSKDKIASKAALAAAHAQAEKEGGIVRIVEDEGVGADGKRAISYAIEKNKGLAPKRKKDVRNPRVRKRKKYEDKKKKLGSMRPVYKGGEGRGGYGGEKTGIKKGLVKSVRL